MAASWSRVGASCGRGWVLLVSRDVMVNHWWARSATADFLLYSRNKRMRGQTGIFAQPDLHGMFKAPTVV